MSEIQNPEELTVEVVDEFIKRRIERGVRPVSVNSSIRHLKTIFKFTVNRGLLYSNPFASIEFLQERPKEKKVVTLAEEKQLIEAAENAPQSKPLNRLRMSAVIRLAAGAGLRRSEIMNLRWSDINLNTGKIDVKNHDGFRTKNGWDRVTFIACKEALAILRKLKDMGLGSKNGQPFYWADGRHLSDLFKKLKKRAGVNCTLHDLRRSFVTRLTEAGENTMLIMKLVGHGSVEVTRDHYLGLGEKILREAVERAQKHAERALNA